MREYWRWGVAGAVGALIAVYFAAGSASDSIDSVSPDRAGKNSNLRSDSAFSSRPGRPAREPVAVKDPTSDDYDSVVLKRLTEMSVTDVFDAEPRKERWAHEFEAAIEDYVSGAIGELFPSVSVSTECKTASCKVSYGIEGVEGEELAMFQEYVQAFVPIGSTMSPSLSVSDDGKPIYTNTALISAEMLDHDSFFEFVRRARNFYADKRENADQMVRALQEKGKG